MDERKKKRERRGGEGRRGGIEKEERRRIVGYAKGQAETSSFNQTDSPDAALQSGKRRSEWTGQARQASKARQA